MIAYARAGRTISKDLAPVLAGSRHKDFRVSERSCGRQLFWRTQQCGSTPVDSPSARVYLARQWREGLRDPCIPLLAQLLMNSG